MGVGLPQDQDFSLSREEMGGWTFGITTTGRERSNQRQNSVALSHKVSDSALTCIRLNNVTGASQLGIPQVNIGRFAAVGDAEGTITLLKLSSNLYEPQPKEKETIMEIFEREKKKAEILKKQRLENEVRKTMLAKEKASKMNHVKMQNQENGQIDGLEKNFYDDVKKRFEELGLGGDSSDEEGTSGPKKETEDEDKSNGLELSHFIKQD